MFGQLSKTMRLVESTLNSCQEIAGSEVSDQASSFLPVDTLLVFEMIRNRYSSEFESNETQLNVTCDEKTAVAVANPFLLQELFSLIFDILLKRAFADSEISIVVEFVDQKLRYEFRGSGGIANQSRDSFAQKSGVRSVHEIINQEFGSSIAEARLWLEQWGGALRIFSCELDRLNLELVLDTQLISSPETEKKSTAAVAREPGLGE